MAKQLVGPFERHVEKAAVGVAAIILIGVIARYLVTSPNQIELGGQPVTPGEIDARVERKASEVSQRLRNVPLPEVEFEPLYDRLVTVVDPFENEQLNTQVSAAAPFAPGVPIIDDPGAIEGQRKLVEVVRLTKPVFTHGRTLFQFDVVEVRNWVTVSAVFDRKQQSRRLAKEYGAARDQVVFGPTQVQRRQRRVDGSWSEEDWDFVDPFTSVRMSPVPEVPFSESDGQPIVLGEDFNRINKFFEDLANRRVQVALLRPLMPPHIVGTTWEFPMITEYVDVVLQDDEILHPELPGPSPELEDRYGLRRVEDVMAPTAELSPTEQIDAKLRIAKQKLDDAQTAEAAIIAFNLFREVEDDTDASAGQVNIAKRGARDAEQKQRDIKRRDARGGLQPSDKPEQEQAARALHPTQQVWVHDALAGSVKSGATYQYRMRAQIFNLLVGEPNKFANPEDAKVIFVQGPWSDPSEPVVVEPDRQYFFTGFDQRRELAKVELYQWFDGVWVMTRHEVRIGDRVKTVARAEVPVIEDPGAVDRPPVPFDAGMSVLDINYARPLRKRDEIRGGGIRFSSNLETDCAVILMDDDGELHERQVMRDKDNPEKRRVAKMVWKPKRTE